MCELTMGQRIAQQRKKLGLSQEALGDQMGVSRQAISKWEADGAVPEIDKLIALSKLFGVTVGCLLGLEEPQEVQTGEAFTEEQLKLVEQIVRSYRPQDVQPMPLEKPRSHRWLRIAVAVVAIVVLFSVWSGLSEQINNTTHQINGLNSGYYSILSKLNLLAERLDEMVEGEKLISEIAFDAVAWDDRNGANIIFTAVPKSWKEDDSSYISLRLAGEEVEQFPCKWSGGVCRAELSLKAKNGYAFYYVVTHADGTQEQQLLKNTGLEELADALVLRCHVTVHPDIDGDRIVFPNYSMDVSAPKIRKENEHLHLATLDWVLTFHGEAYFREPVSPHMLNEEVSNIQIGGNGLHQFTLPAANIGDLVTLSVEATLSDGSHIAVDTATFRYTSNGWTAE